MEVRKLMKKRILIILSSLVTLTICLTGCFIASDDIEKTGLGEKYDSDKIQVSGESWTIGKERVAELFNIYSKAANETEFVVHENTAIVIAEAVMRELYPDDNYGVVRLPIYFQPKYYKAVNCWEVWIHKNGLDTSISFSDRNPDEIMLVYVDVNTAAVKAIIPLNEFSVHNPANADYID
jgi:hypothetical protein